MIVAQPQQDTRRRFLDRFPDSLRSVVANSFIDATRAGAATVPDVQRCVERAWLCRLDAGERVRDGLTRRRAQTVLDALAAHPDEAADFAAWALEWASLPAEERARRKRCRSEEHRRAWLDAQPATPRQINYCRLLGYQGAIESKRHASEIIDRLKGTRVA